MRRHHHGLALAEHELERGRIFLGEVDIGPAHGHEPRFGRLWCGAVGSGVKCFHKVAIAPRSDFAQKVAKGGKVVFWCRVRNPGAAGDFPQAHLFNRHFGQGLLPCGEQLFVKIAMVIGFGHSSGLVAAVHLDNVKI